MVLLSTAGLDEEHFGLIDQTRAEHSIKYVIDFSSFDIASIRPNHPISGAMAEDAAHEAVAIMLVSAVCLQDGLHLFCGLVPVHHHSETQPCKYLFKRL